MPDTPKRPRRLRHINVDDMGGDNHRRDLTRTTPLPPDNMNPNVSHGLDATANARQNEADWYGGDD
jgi:hypothetical protein